MRTSSTDERGISLLMTMLLILLLLVAVTGASMRTTAERRSAMDIAAQVDAFALAQSGVDRYLEAHTTIPTTFPDSAVYTMTGGRAVVTMHRMRAAPSDTIFVIASRGENSAFDRYDANSSVAVRTVAQMIRFSSGSINLPGGFTALSGFHKNGVSGLVSGVDACPGSTKPPIPGLAVPNGTFTYTGGNSNWIDGNPDNTAAYIGTAGTGGTAKDVVTMDWAGITARTSLTPTYYLKTTSPTSGSWPSAAQMGGTNYPVVFVEGDATLPSSGQGILVVTGNLTVGGSRAWKGIVLVGGTFTSNGNNKVLGGIITGLNVKLGINVPVNTLGNGNKTIQYESCEIAKAMAQFGGWQRVRNGWLDNWPSY